ncbi:hypothetical protein [Chitinilyticum piscinae]|uniref:Uncharacterized protein n=1 Tax=Chitinilyticum piscinae TaxID=2866724 RepID=A0A8J7K0T2_9NEIS|nr:hypothetical protein [Chitinilyticum piscinae]MBE9608381.1 hypothetical protein [Chitinilyticum piscinae]
MKDLVEWFLSYGWLICLGALFVANSFADSFFKNPKTASKILIAVSGTYVLLMLLSLLIKLEIL